MSYCKSKHFLPILVAAFLFYTAATYGQAVKKYSNFKAVIVVGNTEDGTKSAMVSMDSVAEELKRHGVKVSKFYDTAANWNKIQMAATGAHFFIYNGHGSHGGGLNINRGGTTRDILELKLAPNAVVAFQSVCYGAGSTAGDSGPIDGSEASKRVMWYADPFLKSGAGCYFACNVTDGVKNYLRLFLSGENGLSCWDKSVSFSWAKQDTTLKYVNDTSKSFCLATTNWGGTSTVTKYANGVKSVKEVPSHKSFDVAFIGRQKFSVNDLLKTK